MKFKHSPSISLYILLLFITHLSSIPISVKVSIDMFGCSKIPTPLIICPFLLNKKAKVIKWASRLFIVPMGIGKHTPLFFAIHLTLMSKFQKYPQFCVYSRNSMYSRISNCIPPEYKLYGDWSFRNTILYYRNWSFKLHFRNSSSQNKNSECKIAFWKLHRKL